MRPALSKFQATHADTVSQRDAQLDAVDPAAKAYGP